MKLNCYSLSLTLSAFQFSSSSFFQHTVMSSSFPCATPSLPLSLHCLKRSENSSLTTDLMRIAFQEQLIMRCKSNLLNFVLTLLHFKAIKIATCIRCVCLFCYLPDWVLHFTWKSWLMAFILDFRIHQCNIVNIVSNQTWDICTYGLSKQRFHLSVNKTTYGGGVWYMLRIKRKEHGRHLDISSAKEYRCSFRS